jgi:cytochrome bd-I ubiquinol oxidase subunit X
LGVQHPARACHARAHPSPRGSLLMWYFSWILGLGLALTFGVLNAIWYEILEAQREARNPEKSAPPPL